MKLFLLTGALFVLAGIVRAQDQPLPKPETPETATPATLPSATPLPSPELIPPEAPAVSGETIPPTGLPGLSELDEGFKAAPISPLAAKQRQHLEWRRLRNAVEKDLAVRAALTAAEAARTDLEKRKRLGLYYDLLYGKMIARAAPDMKAYLANRKREALRGLPQPRVRPELKVSKSAAGNSPADSGSPAPSPSPLENPTRVNSLLDPVP